MEKRSSLCIAKSVAFALILREVRGRIGAKRMGAFWFVFEPLAHVLVMTAIMTVIRHRTAQGMEFPVFLVTGLVPFLLFKNIALRGMSAIEANQGLFAYRQIKPFDCILARLVVEFLMMACVYLVMIFSLGYWGDYDISVHRPLYWLAMIGTGLVLSFSLALIFAALVEAVPEIKAFIRVMFIPLYLLSGVIIPIWMLPEAALKYLSWNPFFHLVDVIRQGVFAHYPVTTEVSITYLLAFTLISLSSGLLIYRGRHRQLVAL